MKSLLDMLTRSRDAFNNFIFSVRTKQRKMFLKKYFQENRQTPENEQIFRKSFLVKNVLRWKMIYVKTNELNLKNK